MRNDNMTNKIKKNNEICEKMMDAYLSLDKNEVVPPRLTLHLLTCQNCRTEVHYLSQAEKIAAKPLKERIGEETVQQNKKNPISMTKWVLCGCIMMILLMVFGIASKSEDSELQVSFYIFFALSVCAYCAVFIGANLDYFIKKIDTMNFTM